MSRQTPAHNSSLNADQTSYTIPEHKSKQARVYAKQRENEKGQKGGKKGWWISI